MSQKIHIGTSGWYYKHWDDVFYPKEVKSTDRLHFYAAQFCTVEVNTTFYHLPSLETVKNWNDLVPKNFIFSIKASRYITHIKRLVDYEKSLPKFFESLKSIQSKLGPILFQLPPSFEKNAERLEAFLKHLKKDHNYTFEFRHPSWFDDEIYSLLKHYQAALCITDLGGSLSPEEITAKFIYIRLHGPKSAYQGYYGTKKLTIWKDKLLKWAHEGLSIYCYFDNDEKGYAIQDASELKKMIENE